MTRTRITASQHVTGISIYAAGVQASTLTRTLAGTVVRYGVPGRTSAGTLRVRAGALRFPDDLTRVKLTREHDRAEARGHLTLVQNDDNELRAAMRVSDGPLGDAALAEARDHTRDGFSIDVIDATIAGDEITDALVIAIGQVGIPAYDDSRIDTIAASHSSRTTQGDSMTPAQRARLAELRALQTRTAEQEAELSALAALEAANPDPAEPAADPATPAPAEPAAEPGTGTATASIVPTVPGGVPSRSSTTTQPRPRGLRDVVRDVTAALAANGGASVAGITAAFSDIIHSDHTDNIEQPAWSGELWSGLQYEPEWSDLFATGDLTNWEGRGWRFTSKLEIQDYAGDKAAVPSDQVTTEPSTYEAARMAVGVDIDRKFYDFPNEGFVTALVEQVRESWAIQLDGKVRTYALSKAVAGSRTAAVTRTNGDATLTAPAGTFRPSDEGATIAGAGIPALTTILSVTSPTEVELSAAATAGGVTTATIGAQEGTVLKAAARARLILKRRKVGNASFIVLNDEDMFTLLDVNEKEVSAFLNLFGVEPGNFRSSADVPQGTLVAGVKQAAVVRTLPGSPIRVSAQHLANGGVDEAFFGYWAIEEHHKSGIVSVKFNPAAV